eukprot:TRINITY_DN1988_c0_g1_i2.p1 TRINITY_DN1988_c0_g1~~TRINITY_DN1988_c0_g1_i2.p1  ORF type:complete len:242 (-),score=34.34 TRINITY_DN1988_c0_g1_i2:67-792(-)
MANVGSVCFLDIDIGNAAEYEAQKTEFERAQEFARTNGASYGMKTSVLEMGEEEKEALKDIYLSNPALASLPIRLDPPQSLRVGRLVIQMLDDAAPKACENFRALCTGEKGVGKVSRRPLHYRGCKFHRIIPGFMAQSGDFVFGDGSGGESVFGKKTFNDEKGGLKLKHNDRGIVAMANSGKNSNNSQFYITFAPVPNADGQYVIFGRVVSGIEVLDAIEACGSRSGQPSADVVIADCGLL